MHDEPEHDTPPDFGADAPIPYTVAEPGEPAPTEAAPPPPKSAIDWQRTNLTPGLVRALARAQAQVQTVGKSGRNTTGDGYDYATADSMIAEARRVFAGQDLYWLCVSRSLEPPTFDLGTSRWACSLVVTESIVMHVDEHGVVGMLVSRGECVSIGSGASPPDKADKAAETYLRGYIARDLLAIDRAKVKSSEDVDARGDSPSEGGKGRTSAKPDAATAIAETELRDGCNKMIRAIQESRTAQGEPRPSAANLIAELMGAGWSARSVDEWKALSAKLSSAVAAQHTKASGRRGKAAAAAAQE